MQTIILPGYSAKNKTWVDEVAKNIDIAGIIRPFYWGHWSDENIKFNAKEKAELIAKHLKGDVVNIIAKSIATLVASYLYQIIPDQIEKMIFCGIPVKNLSTYEIEDIKNIISLSGEKFIGFQNINDPYGSFEDVKYFGNIKTTDRSDHEYPFFEEFQNFLN